MRGQSEYGRYGPQNRMDENTSAWTRLLNSIRLEKGLTQQSIALDAGVSTACVSLVEKGRLAHLSKHTVVCILDKYFGSSFDSQLLEAVRSTGLLDSRPEPETVVPVRSAVLTVPGAPKHVRWANRNDTWAGLLNRIRIVKQLTQQDVADATGTNRTTVSRLETGKLYKLSKYALSYLLKEYSGTPFDQELLTALKARNPVLQAETLADALVELKIV